MVMTLTIAFTRRPTLAQASEQVYAAECALHAARQAQDDTWVSAAYERLHQALVLYCDLQLSAQRPPAA
jgi:hypothetical protein